jgi:hypothetical protein
MRRVWAGVFLAVCAGCGTDGYRLAPVSGRVAVDGKPVAGLTVTFEPVGSRERPNPGPGAVGVTDRAGRFQLSTVPGGRRGAVVGPCRVRIRVVVHEGGDADPWLDPALPRSRPSVRHLPLRYNDKTELTFEVPPGGTEAANFELSWK